MESRLRKETILKQKGPVITISREMGCPAKAIAEVLVKLLNNDSGREAKWKYLSNEIMEESARMLKVDPKYIRHIFTYDDRNMLDEILVATRKEHRYKSDRAIKNTIGQLIKSFGDKGHYVIIGRAGVAHTRHIQRSIHVRLNAPLDWRISKVQEFKQTSRQEALDKIRRGDRNRSQFLKYYMGDIPLTDYFDISLNCAGFSIKHIAEIIYEAYNKKSVSIIQSVQTSRRGALSRDRS